MDNHTTFKFYIWRKVESKIVNYKPIKEIDYFVLPEESVYFEILTDQVLSRIKKFMTHFY